MQYHEEEIGGKLQGVYSSFSDSGGFACGCSVGGPPPPLIVVTSESTWEAVYPPGEAPLSIEKEKRKPKIRHSKTKWK